MVRGDLNLKRVILYDVYREQDSNYADPIGKVINLNAKKEDFLHLNSVIERNVKKKIISKEATDASRKLAKSAAIERFDDVELRGQPARSMILSITDNDQRKELNDALKATTDNDFKIACAPLSTKFADFTRYPKGVIGFVQFDFQISRKKISDFLSILITDYDPSLCRIDTQTVLKYLEKSFKHNFRTTMIYPYIFEDIKSKSTLAQQQTQLETDNYKIKIHSKADDPAIYKLAGVSEPRLPQKEVENIYSKKISDLKDISDIEKFTTISDLKKSEVTISIPEKLSFKVDLKTFLEQFQIFIGKSGSGIFVKNANIEVFLGKRNLLSEQKIKFKSIDEIAKDDNSNRKE